MTPSIFDYQDYRTYLRAVLKERQDRLAYYPLQRFARALGFSSHSGLAMVLSGKRDLKSPYLEQCAKNLGLKVNERLYLEAMVRAGSLSPAKRRTLLREVQFLGASWTPPEPEENIKLLEYGLVHQILCQTKAFMTLAEIQRRFRYPVERKNLETVLMFMLDHNQIVAIGDRFRIQTDVLIFKDDRPNVSGAIYHRDSLSLAMNALSDALDRREFQTYHLTVDTRRLPEIKAELKKFAQEFIAKFEADLDADTVLQFHTHMFEAAIKSPEPEVP